MSDAITARADGRAFLAFTALLWSAVLAFLGWLLLVREGGGARADLSFLPAVNAALNTVAATLLVAGWVAIRRGARRAHQYLMVSAFATSVLFLVGYVLYHYAHGDTPFTGEGVIRLVYFAILITHVLLSMTVMPLALVALWLAYKKRFTTHKKVTRWLAPIWLYVSVTGVIIFFMLHVG